MNYNNNLNSQPILIKFPLKLFVCKCLAFQTHLLLDLRFPLKSVSTCALALRLVGTFVITFL